MSLRWREVKPEPSSYQRALPDVISTIRGAIDGQDDHGTLEVNVGWLRELCDAAERRS